MQMIILAAVVTVVVPPQGAPVPQNSQVNTSVQESQVWALGEQFLKEDFEGFPDEGEVRYWKSRYSKEHMAKEKRLGPTGIQLRSARPVDVPMFFLVNSWKINKVEVKGKQGLMFVEFDRLVIAKHNKTTGRFEYRKDLRNPDIQVIKMVFDKSQWYIDCPTDLHMSAKLYRQRVANSIETEERFLAEELDENAKTGKLGKTLKSRAQGLKVLKNDIEALDAALGAGVNFK